ncbi:MAG: hypothetical protein QXT72_03310 [Candidatus Micrarchaeia archaeon]
MSDIVLDTYDTISSMNIKKLTELIEKNWSLKKKVKKGISDVNI